MLPVASAVETGSSDQGDTVMQLFSTEGVSTLWFDHPTVYSTVLRSEINKHQSLYDYTADVFVVSSDFSITISLVCSNATNVF